jgi:hypothetical protein
MTLVVEDGTGKADAESYIAVSDANAYHIARGNSDWAALASDAIREQLLRKATDYIEQIYTGAWLGQATSSTQALSWPRCYVERIERMRYGYDYYPSDFIPPELGKACAELALRAASGDLAADLEPTISSAKVGPISVAYDPNGLTVAKYRVVDNLLAKFLFGRGNMTKLVRT